MAEPAIDPDLLSAYVDGEATPEEAARISRAAAAEPAIARQIAVLQTMRAHVAGIGEDFGPVPIQEPMRPARHRGRHFAGLLAAAASGAALVAGIALWQGEGFRPAAALDPSVRIVADDPDLGRMIAAYDDAARQVDAAQPAEAAADNQRLTDLIGATGLRLVRFDGLTLGDGRTASEAVYLGPKGCRLSLFETVPAPGATTDPGLLISESGTLHVAQWQAQSRYVLVSRGMDAMRFTTIARSLATATTRHDAEDGDLVAALSVAHQHCVG